MNMPVFTIEALTVGDLCAVLIAAKTSDIAVLLTVADKCAAGGIMHLPIDGHLVIIEAFGVALKTYFESLKEAQNAQVSQLLQQALGVKGNG